MAGFSQTIQTVLGELGMCLARVDENAITSAVDELDKAARVFVCGAGRSGIAARAFAMRLFHLGIPAYVTGETVTPPIEEKDLLLVCSGSGRTESLFASASKARKTGARILLVTIDPHSLIAGIADTVLTIPAPSPKAKLNGNGNKCDTDHAPVSSVQPMGSLFEQSMFLLLDGIIVLLMNRRNITGEEMFKRHANLE